jgi:hypothetical protein
MVGKFFGVDVQKSKLPMKLRGVVMAESKPEPWLRGGRGDIPAVPRAVIHALELAAEDLRKWCGDLSEEELHARPAGLPSVAFHEACCAEY